MNTRCQVCGRPVSIISEDGTSYYGPPEVDEAMMRAFLNEYTRHPAHDQADFEDAVRAGLEAVMMAPKPRWR